MKKSKVLITAIVGGAVLLAGCANTLTPASVSKNLNHNLSVLQNTVEKLDTINNSYLSNPDIYPVSNNSIKAPSLSLNSAIPIRTETQKIATSNLTNNDNSNVDDHNLPVNDINTTNIYYYNVKPIKYTPRYLQDISALENGDYLSNYISKIKTLYAITSDVIEANTALDSCKNYVLNYVIEIKDLNKEIENGTFEPSNQQIAALNNYIGDIKTTIKRIKRCNGELSNEVNNINKTDSTGITTGIDVVKSNYLKVLNHLDTRITYLKNALTTLEQIKGILQEVQNIVENNEVNENINNENYGNQNNISIEENVINENNSDIDNNENIDNNEDTLFNNNDLTNDENNIVNNEDDLLNNNNNNQEKLSDNVINENSTSSNEDELNTSETEDEAKTNIDTYESTINNLDTYKPEISDDTEIQEDIENNNNININDETTGNIEQNTEVSDNNLSNNNIVDNTIINGNNLAYGTDEDKINAPNGVFQNGIITQNNLNNGVNNGVNGFGTGNGTNYENLNNSYNNTANKTNKNVDTYGYNTIIDMINHGTVNNGINTLSVESSTKPSMVNSDEVTVPNNDDYKIELLSQEN